MRTDLGAPLNLRSQAGVERTFHYATLTDLLLQASVHTSCADTGCSASKEMPWAYSSSNRLILSF